MPYGSQFRTLRHRLTAGCLALSLSVVVGAPVLAAEPAAPVPAREATAPTLTTAAEGTEAAPVFAHLQPLHDNQLEEVEGESFWRYVGVAALGGAKGAVSYSISYVKSRYVYNEPTQWDWGAFGRSVAFGSVSQLVNGWYRR